MAFHLSLLKKGLLMVSVPLALQLGLVAWLYHLHDEAEQDLQRSAHAREVSDAINQLVKDIYEIGTRAMNENMDEIWKEPEYVVAEQDLKREVASLRELVKDNRRQSDVVAEVERAANRAFQLLDDAKNLYETQHYVRKSEPRRNIFRQLRRQVRIIVSENLISMGRDEKEFATASPRRQAQIRGQLSAVLIGIVLVNIVLTVVIAVSFYRGIVARLSVMMDNSYRLASDKPLNEPVGGNDEIAALDGVFHRMALDLTEAARKERAIVENARDVICSLDSKGTFVALSPASQSVFGYQSDELMGSKLINLVVDEDQAHTLDQIKIVMEGGEEPPFETRMRHKSGKIIDIIWSATWSQAEGTMFCVAHDITERKEAERLRQEVMQMVSHDLRTPLASVRSFHEMLESGMFGELSARGKELLAVADRSTGRMLTLVKDLVDIERMEAGMLELHKADVSVSSLFEQAANAAQSAAASQKVQIVSEDTDLSIYADGDRIVQVLINLLTNAIKFSPAGKNVTLRAERLSGFVEIKVIDEGRGVPENMQSTIFDRFKQVQISDAKDKGGSGLGLAICRALVELHGGNISVASKDNLGSVFSFRIPFDDATLSHVQLESSSKEEPAASSEVSS